MARRERLQGEQLKIELCQKVSFDVAVNDKQFIESTGSTYNMN